MTQSSLISKMIRQRVWIVYLFLITAVTSVIIKNDARIWPPTLLAYSFKINDLQSYQRQNLCSENSTDYYFLGVGQNVSTNVERLCLSNSPIGLVWTYPIIFNTKSLASINLEAKIDHRQLILWYNKTVF